MFYGIFQEEIQKLAAQIEFMKIVHMEMNNRHLKPKSGGYFSAANVPVSLQSPVSRSTTGGLLLAHRGINENDTTMVDRV